MQKEWPLLLLGWYDENKRQLPWREQTDAYRTWVSEVMLQQTRVEAVKDYYRRFLERFPAIENLAAATEEEVLQQWQGLGYYSRARNLWQGAKETVAQYGGEVPKDEKSLRALPGVGEYTAGAILSIAYQQAVPAVDGNVLRVFSRLYGLQEEVQTTAAKKMVAKLVSDVLPAKRPGDFNQALMDFGAAICIPETPRCEACPVTSHCLARLQGQERILPVRKPKKPPTCIHVAVGLAKGADGYLLEKRPARGLLAGMWQFVSAEAASENEAAKLLSERGLQLLQPAFPLWRVSHVFSHRRWELAIYECAPVKDLPKSGGLAVREEALATVLWAGPHQKIFEWLEKNKKDEK